MFNKKDLQLKPIERAETIPSNWYYDENILNIEKETVFANNWNMQDISIN